MNKITQSMIKAAERVLIVVVDKHKPRELWTADDIVEEMKELVMTCNGEVIDAIIARIKIETAGTLIGSGKVAEIAQLCQLKAIDTAVFSYDLKGSQQRNLEEAIKAKTIDRTQLILDIFARHAKSSEGKIQVELAQLEYLKPRLVGHGIELSRLGGGIGTLGPGETKLETDRRRIEERITRLRHDLKDIAASHSLTRKKRKGKGVPIISLIGYTNAGKSTLLNALTDAHQVTKDALFTTLDSLSRQFTLPNHQKVILSDTVGFLRELPHHLIESFKTTLDEVREADLLLHVVDVSHPQFRNMIDSVDKVLAELKVLHKPVIMVFNKIDQLSDQRWFKGLVDNFRHAVCVSALKGDNMDELTNQIGAMLSSMMLEINVNVPMNRMDLVNLAHEQGSVISIKYYDDHINIRANIPLTLEGKFPMERKDEDDE